MGRIRVLAPNVVNQIAAGEVIERPASAVKELIENAIDAGATRVEVLLVEGGKARIEVRDDGRGMDADDLAAAFLPHATSKLSGVGDLEHIASLGFRGEALASIGSVARASITSRPAERPAERPADGVAGSLAASDGASVEDREGVIGDVRPAAAAPGTVVVVEGLFAGVPARRKFLRSAATELGHAVEWVERFALAHPDVAFRLDHESRRVVETAAGEGRLARIARFHGDALAKSLIAVRSGRGDPIAIEAWISPPGVSRADARLQQTYLSGRFIRDRTVMHAMREAYRDLVPPGDRQPIAFLFLDCDPARVDVNVHPTKAEVRWRDSSVVHEAVRRTLRAALEAARPGVAVPVGAERPSSPGVPRSTVNAAEFAFTRGVGERRGFDPLSGRWGGAGASCGFEAHESEGSCRHGAADPYRSSTVVESAERAAAPDFGATAPATAERRSTVRVGRAGLMPVGQILGTYLVLESRDEAGEEAGLVLVDQHALHERVLFDRISDRLRDGALEVQHLLVPAVVSLSRAEVARIEEERDLFERLGWVVEAFGEDAVAVRACPAVLRRPDPEGMLREVLALLETGRREGLDRAALLSSVVDRMACRAAVMAGDALHPDEVVALLEQAESLNHAHSCPHGRPTRLVVSRRDLERYFHRA